jgi:hypothetical protein
VCLCEGDRLSCRSLNSQLLLGELRVVGSAPRLVPVGSSGCTWYFAPSRLRTAQLARSRLRALDQAQTSVQISVQAQSDLPRKLTDQLRRRGQVFIRQRRDSKAEGFQHAQVVAHPSGANGYGLRKYSVQIRRVEYAVEPSVERFHVGVEDPGAELFRQGAKTSFQQADK